MVGLQNTDELASRRRWVDETGPADALMRCYSYSTSTRKVQYYSNRTIVELKVNHTVNRNTTDARKLVLPLWQSVLVRYRRQCVVVLVPKDPAPLNGSSLPRSKNIKEYGCQNTVACHRFERKTSRAVVATVRGSWLYISDL